MQSVFHHINRAKKQSHPVRKQIAYVGAGIGTGIIALIWLATSLATDAFLIHDSSLTRGLNEDTGVTAVDANQLAGLPAGQAGVAAALSSDSSAPASIKIIDAPTSSASAKQPERTVLPF